MASSPSSSPPPPSGWNRHSSPCRSALSSTNCFHPRQSWCTLHSFLTCSSASQLQLTPGRRSRIVCGTRGRCSMAKSLLKHCIFFPGDTNQIVAEGFGVLLYTFDSGTGCLKQLNFWAKEMVPDWTYHALVATLFGRHKDEGFSLNSRSLSWTLFFCSGVRFVCLLTI
jgi:hypothetical protein